LSAPLTTERRPITTVRRGFGRPFVLVTGGKGGVGKSTVAANLGVLLAQRGVDPLLVDLDFGLANLDVMLGLEPERNLEDFLGGDHRLEECICRGPASLNVLPAGSGTVGMARPDPQRLARLIAALRVTASDHGLVLGDSAAGIGPEVMEFAAEADRVLVVTTSEPAAVTDAYGVIKAIDTHAGERGIEVPTPDLFVNLVSGIEEARAVAGNLRTVCERFLARSPRMVGWMPRSRSVLQGIIGRTPFVLSSPRALTTRCLERLAERYARTVPPRDEGISPLKASERHVR
jgi:flagellar biosynthesis protein FlhG